MTLIPDITAPVSHARVPRKAPILGTLRGVSEWVETWLVVDTGTHYHPQAHLGRAGSWQATSTLGRSGDFDANREFVIHILAVTQDVSNAFEQYLKDAGKQGKWPGVPKPPDGRVLSTLRVVRDDSASPFGFMEGVYDEWSKGVATGGMISMKLNPPDHFATEATNRTGKTEWTGSIKMDISSNPTQGKGTYSYSAKADSGEHRLMVDAATGDLRIEGKNTSQPGGKSFQTVWKRRT